MRWFVGGLLLLPAFACFEVSSVELDCVPQSDAELCAGDLLAHRVTDPCTKLEIDCECQPESLDELCPGWEPALVEDRCGVQVSCPCLDEPIEELCSTVTPGTSLVGRCARPRHCPCVDDCPEPADGSVNSCGDVCVPLVDGFDPLVASGDVPQPRSYAAMAWDPSAGEGLLEGGQISGNSAVAPPGTFRFRLEADSAGARLVWTRADLASCVDAQPLDATGHVLAWHAGLQRIVRFGGWTGFNSSPKTSRPEVYGWNGACFERLPEFDLGLEGNPTERHEVQWASNPVRGELVLLGGVAQNECHETGRDELWRWSQTGWERSTFSIRTDAEDDAGYRYLHAGAAVYDPFRGMVVFGGSNTCREPSLFADTLIVRLDDPPAAEWIPERSSDAATLVRERFAMAYASGPGVSVRTSGKSFGGVLEFGTFRLDDASGRWLEFDELRAAPPRSSGGTMIDVPGWGLLLFDGRERPPAGEPQARLFSNRALRKRLGQSREP